MRKLAAVLCLCLATALPAQDRSPGERLFREGLGATAILAGGGVEVSAANFACAGCHGDDARGNREGSTIFPSLLVEKNGSITVAHTPDDLVALLQDGRMPDGRTLSVVMPRYRADAATLASLHEYLTGLARAGRVGVTAQAILLGPPSDIRAGPAFALALRIANESGGAWSRRFEISSTTTPLLVADEAMGILQGGIDRVLVQAVANELSQRGLSVIALDGGTGGLMAMLLQYGIAVAPVATARLRLQGGTAAIVADSAETIVFDLAAFVPELEEIPPEARLSYLAGREIARAALACGRALSRRCVLERVKSADLTQ